MRLPCSSLQLILLLFVLVPRFLGAQEPTPPDGRGHPLEDPLLDALVGDWAVTRTMAKRTAHDRVQAEWVLEHQFLRMHYQDVATPSAYEAMVFLGYDRAGKHYVAHWIDVFGGHFSRTLGYGQREGSAIRFAFAYPDGPFENTFTFDPEERTWTSRMRQQDAAGTWTTFAEDRFRPVPTR